MLTTEGFPTLIWNISNLERNLIFDFPMQCTFSGKKKFGKSCRSGFRMSWKANLELTQELVEVVFRIRNANPYFICCCNEVCVCVCKCVCVCVCVREIVSNCVVSVFDHQCLGVTNIGVSWPCLWSRFSGSFLCKLNNLTVNRKRNMPRMPFCLNPEQYLQEKVITYIIITQLVKN